MDNKALQHLENQYCHEQQCSQYSHHFYWIEPSSAHFHCIFCYFCVLILA